MYVRTRSGGCVCFLHVRAVKPDCGGSCRTDGGRNSVRIATEAYGRGLALCREFGRLPVRPTTNYDDWIIDRWRVEPQIKGIRLPVEETDESSPPLSSAQTGKPVPNRT